MAPVYCKLYAICIGWKRYRAGRMRQSSDFSAHDVAEASQSCWRESD
jgi:hypothetical protein